MPPAQFAVAALARILLACCLVDAINFDRPDPLLPVCADRAESLSKAQVAEEASAPDNRVSPIKEKVYGGVGGGRWGGVMRRWVDNVCRGGIGCRGNFRTG